MLLHKPILSVFILFDLMQKKRRLSIGADTDKHFYLLERETGNIPGINA